MVIEIPSEAMSSLLKLPEQVAESFFEVLLGSQETQKCFWMIELYCCDILESKGMSAAWHGAGRQHLFVRCPSMSGHMLFCKNSSSCTDAEKMEP